MLDEMDDGARVGVWAVIGMITLLLFGLLGGLSLRQLHRATAPAAAPVVVVEEVLLDLPLGGELAGTVLFAVGSFELPADVASAIAKARAAAEAAPAKRVMLSGFHDASGDPVRNAELARDRAKAVREALAAAGLDRARTVLRKPESTTGDGPPEQARRVEIRLID